jgi:phosphohistidine phosphatase SixA
LQPSDESKKDVLRPDTNRSIMMDFKGAKLSPDTGFLSKRELDQRHNVIALNQIFHSQPRILSLMQSTFALMLAVALIGLNSSAAAGVDESVLWQMIKAPGHFVMVRHALAPGTGDPEGFTIGKCDTQRNLSEKGRAQAKRIGQRFREHGIKQAQVYSSQWCRCLETADLMGLGPVNELAAINSFFGNFQLERPQTRQLSEWLKKRKIDQPLVLITHQVNITAFTDIFPASGEMVVIRRTDSGEFRVVGTIQIE